MMLMLEKGLHVPASQCFRIEYLKVDRGSLVDRLEVEDTRGSQCEVFGRSQLSEL